MHINIMLPVTYKNKKMANSSFVNCVSHWRVESKHLHRRRASNLDSPNAANAHGHPFCLATLLSPLDIVSTPLDARGLPRPCLPL